MPKSATIVLPSLVSRMFSGFTSRWITPWSWAYWRPRATSRAILTASGGESRPSRPSRSRNDSPSIHGIVNHRMGGTVAREEGISPES
jgi:hypothetical protein